MAAGAVAGEMQKDDQQDQDDADDPGDFHPAWCAGRRSSVEPQFVAGLGLILHVLSLVARDTHGELLMLLFYDTLCLVSRQNVSMMLSRILRQCQSCGTRRSTHIAATSAMRSWTPLRHLWPGMGCYQ